MVSISQTLLVIISVLVVLLFVNVYLIILIRKKFSLLKDIKQKKPITKIEYIDRIIDSNAKKVMENDKFYFEAKPFNYFKRSFFSIRRFKEKRMLKKFPAKVVLVRFEMNNGTTREFLVKDDASGFTYNGGQYVFDLENRYWVVDSLIWAYDFHESLSISMTTTLKPNDQLIEYIKQLEEDSRKGIKKHIPINDLKETIEQSGITQVENSINPIVLERVIKSEIIQAILQGSALGRLFKVLLIISIIVLIVLFIDLAIDFISSPLPEEFGIGGGGDE